MSERMIGFAVLIFAGFLAVVVVGGLIGGLAYLKPQKTDGGSELSKKFEELETDLDERITRNQNDIVKIVEYLNRQARPPQMAPATTRTPPAIPPAPPATPATPATPPSAD